MGRRISSVWMLGLSVWLVLSFVLVVTSRFRHYAELEWMGGAVLEHVERVRAGKPLYVAPSADFVPFIYPPLFFWVSALLSHAVPVWVAARGLSVLATGASALLVYLTSRKLGAKVPYALSGVGAFFGAYSLSGYWYDLERCDALCVALLLASLHVLIRAEKALSYVLAGSLLAFAFFAKQPALIFLFTALVVLLSRSVRQATWLAVGFFGVFAPVALSLEKQSGGYFSYYVFRVPAAHKLDWDLLTPLFTKELGQAFLLLFATICVGVGAVRATLSRQAGDEGVFGAYLIAALLASISGRLHVGGWLNVYIFIHTFSAIALSVVASRADAMLTTSAPKLAFGVPLLVSLQLVHLAYDPKPVSSDAGRVRDRELFEAAVRLWERDGEVVVHGRGAVTHKPHFHIMGLMDVLRAGEPVPPDLRVSLQVRRYAAYVVNEFGELSLEAMLGKKSELYELVLRNYFVAIRLDDRERPPPVGWIAHPSWVLRPRKTPFTGTLEALERRVQVEMGVCEMRMRAVQAGARAFDNGDDIEGLVEGMAR